MDHRVEELAAIAEVSVDTVRFYQSRGLLPPPRRQGRLAYYDDEHLQRLERIRSLQARGLTLTTIGRLLSGTLDEADEALAAALSGSGSPARYTLDELAARSGVPRALLDSVVGEGLLAPAPGGFTDDDATAARAGVRLLEHGLPLPELLDLARRHDAAMREVAERAVELFAAHVRQPLRAEGLDDAEAARRLVDAFDALLPATATLVAHHFTRTLLAVARAHIDQVGAPAELAAVRGASA